MENLTRVVIDFTKVVAHTSYMNPTIITFLLNTKVWTIL